MYFSTAARLCSTARTSAWVFAAVLVLVVWPLSARAQGDTGQITVTVVDAASKTPLPLARVLLDGPVITSELCGPDGKVVFTDVPSGIYRARVAKGGFSQVTSSDFEVLEGKSVTLSVALAKSQDVKSLGTVVVRSTASIGSTSIRESSPVRKLSDTLADALNKLSGVSVSTDPNGDSDASQTVSLEGHDPTQTMLTVDGIPLNAPGAAGDLRQINTDLFSGASVSQGPQAGALGGGVNFTTLQPTLTWQGRMTQSFGTFDKASTQFTLQGSAGNLGIAVVHAARGNDNPLTGATFLDASGLDYAHQGGNLTGGDLVKLRERVGGAQTLTGTFMSSNNYDDLLCTRFSGPLPCGYGPDNFSFRHFAFGSLNDSALIGQVGVQFALYDTHGSFDRNLLNRFVNGVPSPFGATIVQASRGASLNAILPSRERHTISIQASSTTSNVDVTSLLEASRSFANGGSTQRYGLLSISDKINSSPQLTLNDRIGISSSSNANSSATGGIAAAWNPNPDDAFSGSIDVGGSNPGPARLGVLSDPASLRFECDAGIAYGNGPGDPPGPSSSDSIRLGWQHRIRSGQFAATLYRQVQNDVLINTFVNGGALPAGYFPPGYFTIAQQIFQSSAGCGSSAPFGPSNLYITQPVGNSRDLYEGAHLSGGFNVGPNLVVEPYYDIQVAKVLSGDPRLRNPASITHPGAQLPNVPLRRGGITFDYRAPRSSVETLFDAQYVSSNNQSNLPAYVTADAGVSLNLTRGTLTLAGTNLFNAYGASFFSTPQNAVPYVAANGSLLPTLARPLSPRQYSVTYSVKFGEGASSAPVDRLVGTAPTPRPQGGGFFAQLPNLSQPVPARPLDADTSRSSCPPDAAKQAQPIFDALKAYVAAVEAARTASGYPASAPSGAPDVPGLAVGYHGMGSTYALSLTPTQLTAIRSLIRCSPVRVGTRDQAAAQHLYVPQGNAFNRLPLAYSPGAGLYAVRAPQTAGQEQFRLYKLPTAPPSAPFALASSPLCTPDMKPTAQKMLRSLQQYVSGYDPAHPPAAQPAGWTVTSHTSTKGYWLELQPADISTLPDVLTCAHVATAAKTDIQALGFDGANAPELNYAPQLGLYLVRPNFGQQQQPRGN